MPFTGKATYSAGAELPEIAEDVSDVVALASPTDTPLLDLLGDAARPARSVVHEWLEDALLPNHDVVTSFVSTEHFVVENVDRFRVGDQLRWSSGPEVMLITAIDPSTSALLIERGFGGTTQQTAADGDAIHILGNAAAEGADAEAARFTTRGRQSNTTQIFSATVEVSGSELAVNQIGVRDELQYQRAQRVRELLRDLENSVINGISTSSIGGGGVTDRRTLRGIIPSLQSHVFTPGNDGFPADTTLTEEQLNFALRRIWEHSAGQIDTIIVGGREKRAINQCITTDRRYMGSSETFKDRVSVYESDFGTCRVVLSRFVPGGSVLLVDSSRLQVLPLTGRSFHYKPLARTGDRESGQVLGEYTLEICNENAHGLIALT